MALYFERPPRMTPYQVARNRLSEVHNLVLRGIIAPTDHPLLLPARPEPGSNPIHKRLIDACLDTYEMVSQRKESTLRVILERPFPRHSPLVADHALRILYKEMTDLGVPLPEDATSLEDLRAKSAPWIA